MFSLSVPKDDDKKKKKAADDTVKKPAPIIAPLSPDEPVATNPEQQGKSAGVFGAPQPVNIPALNPSAAPAPSQATPPPAAPPVNIPALDPNANPAANINAAASRVPQLLARNAEIANVMSVVQNMPITKQDGELESPLAIVTKDLRLLEAGKKLARNSRGMSALKGAMMQLGNNPRLRNARDWSDVASGAGSAIGGLAGGAINDTWDEEVKRGEIIGGLQNEIKTNNEQIGVEQRVENQNNQTAIRQQQVVLAGQRQKKQGEMIDSRIARNEAQNLSAEQKSVLDPIFKRGYFYEDDVDEATKAKMKSLGIVLADFDNRHKPVEQNGQWLEYNVETRRYEPTQGVPTDPDDVPMTMNVGGKNMTASTKQFLGYLSHKEDQAFAAGQKDIDRKESLRRWAIDNKISLAKFKAGLDEKVSTGAMTQAQAKAALDDFPTDIQ